MKENNDIGNFCKNFCCNVAFGGTILTTLFHFIFCGLPALIGILSLIFGTFSFSSFGFISTQQRTYLLIISAIMLVISAVLYRRECKFCKMKKSMLIKKIILLTSIGFFFIGLTFHLISIIFLTVPSCH